jgi:hypothetical protein
LILRWSLIRTWSSGTLTLGLPVARVAVLRLLRIRRLLLTLWLLAWLLALLRLLAVSAHLRLILTLLIAAQYAENLLAQLAGGVPIAGASLRMSLRILVDHRLYPLLLIAGKIETSEPLHPAMLKFCRAWSRALLGRSALWRTLLGVGAERHCERDH